MAKLRQDMETFSLLVESIYDAAFDPRHWEAFLRGLAGALNAKSGLFRVVDERTRALRAGVYHNLDGPLQEAYRQYYVAKDPIVDALTRAPDVYIAPGEAFLDSADYRHSEFFSDYALPQDNYYICGGLAMRNDEFTIKFGVQRDRKTGPFSWDDAAFIRRFVPHIQRSTRLGHLLDVTGAQASSADKLLESIAVGMVLLDSRQRVLRINSKADHAFHVGYGLSRSQGTVHAVHAADVQRFNHMLNVVTDRARRNGPAAPEALLLTRTADQPPGLVVAVPVTASQSYFQGPWPDASVALFLCNLEDAGLLNREILGRLYGLTRREAHLAAAVSRGKTLAALGEEWGVSRETLRTHLKRVLAKTGTARQADLVRLLTGKPWNLLASQAHR